jgi:hypothetical protein
MNGGRIDVAAGTTVVKDGGAFHWRGGTLAGPGAYDITTGTTFDLPGTGARVIDGTTLRMAALAFDGGSLTLQSGGLLVGGVTDVSGSGTFTVNNGTASLFGPATISNLVMNGGTLNARSGLEVADYRQSGGLVAGAGLLKVTQSFQATAGTISSPDDTALVFDDIDIQTGALDALIGVNTTAKGAVTLNTTGRLTVDDSLVQGQDITVNAGSLTVRADQREAGIVAASATASPPGPGSVKTTVAGDVVLTGGRTTGATAQVGSSVGTCEVDVGGNLTLTGGEGSGASAELFAARAIGSDDDPLSVGRAVALTSGTGEDAYARIHVAASDGNIVLALPGASTGGFTVDGAPVASAGISGFFVAGAPAVLGQNLTIVGRPVTTTAAPPPVDPILVAVLRAESGPILSAREKPVPEEDRSLSNRTLRPNGPLECR